MLRDKVERLLADGFAAGEIRDAVLAESGEQRAALWRLRERIPEAERASGGTVKHDIAVRVACIADFLERAEPALRAIAPYRPSVYGHIGDGNLHFNLRPPPGQTLEEFRVGSADVLTRCVHDLTAALGGSFSAEHGVGILKIGELSATRRRRLSP